MFLFRNAARDKDAEMADAFVNRIDDGLAVGPDLIDIGYMRIALAALAAPAYSRA